MRRVRYQVAMSLDGFIASSDGSYDWIPADPEFDFGALFAQFDTVLLGRRTYEAMAQAGQTAMLGGMKTFVFSRTLTHIDQPGITLVGDAWESSVQALRDGTGKDIWLFGGGELFKSLLTAHLVDTLEIAIVPVLLGGGIPMAPPPLSSEKLKLRNHRVYAQSGMVLLEYDLPRPG